MNKKPRGRPPAPMPEPKRKSQAPVRRTDLRIPATPEQLAKAVVRGGAPKRKPPIDTRR